MIEANQIKEILSIETWQGHAYFEDGSIRSVVVRLTDDVDVSRYHPAWCWAGSYQVLYDEFDQDSKVSIRAEYEKLKARRIAFDRARKLQKLYEAGINHG